MRQLLVIGLATLTFVGCKQAEFDGTFNVFQDLIIEQQHSDDLIDFCERNPQDRWCEIHEDELGKGLELKSGETIYGQVVATNNEAIKLDFGSRGAIRVELPDGVELPRHGGPFAFTAAQIDQFFDVSGDVDVSVSRSGPYREWESCSVSRQRRVCREVPVPGGGYRRECHTETYYEYGEREVEYENVTTTYDLVMNLVKPSDGSMIADFSGRETEYDKDILYRGPCYIDRYPTRPRRRF